MGIFLIAVAAPILLGLGLVAVGIRVLATRRKQSGRWSVRGWMAVVAGVVIIGVVIGGLYMLLSALDSSRDGGQQTVVGVRAEGDQLILALREGCPANTTITVTFSGSPTGIVNDSIGPVTLKLDTSRSPGILNLQDLPADVFVSTAPPDEFDWTSAGYLTVETDRPGRSAIVYLNHFLPDSASHPANEFYVDFNSGVWLTPDEMEAQAGSGLVTVCTPK